MKDSLNKGGIFLISMGVILVPTFLVMNGVDRFVKSESKANTMKNIVLLGGLIGAIALGANQVKKYELKKQKK